MTGAYAYTPAIWPPLAAAIFLAILGLYSWRRRDAVRLQEAPHDWIIPPAVVEVQIGVILDALASVAIGGVERAAGVPVQTEGHVALLSGRGPIRLHRLGRGAEMIGEDPVWPTNRRPHRDPHPACVVVNSRPSLGHRCSAKVGHFWIWRTVDSS